MKKLNKFLSTLLIAVLMCVTLTACGNTLSGTYKTSGDLLGIASSEISYTFSGSDVTITSTTGIAGFEKTDTYIGTYEIIKGETATFIVFNITGDGSSLFSGEFDFAETETGIVIGSTTYTKQ